MNQVNTLNDTATLFLGIDGGGTKTQVLIGRSNGHDLEVLGAGQGGQAIQELSVLKLHSRVLPLQLSMPGTVAGFRKDLSTALQSAWRALAAKMKRPRFDHG